MTVKTQMAPMGKVLTGAKSRLSVQSKAVSKGTKILTHYFKGERLTDALARFDIVAKSGHYQNFETLLINKRKFNIGGLSFNLVKRPDKWGGKKTDYAITKGTTNITSIKRPNIENNSGFGDVSGTLDAVLILFNDSYKESDINTVEMFISLGYKNDCLALWGLYQDGELTEEINYLRSIAVTDLVTI